MKVLHILETSVPELVGYTVRSRYIVLHQRQLAMDPSVVTSPFFRDGRGRHTDTIDGITYFRSNHIERPDKGLGQLRAYWTRFRMLGRYRAFVRDVVHRERPDVIHAHSSYTNGLAGMYASQSTGIPFIYELRTLWGESAVVEDGLSPRSLKYRTVWHLELKAMKGAKRVVAISQGIRNAIVQAGIAPDKIDIIPNGVDTGIFRPRPPDTGLIKALGLENCFLVGFIGSLRRLEGLGLLAEAFKRFRQSEPRARLLIVGDGPERSRLQASAQGPGSSNGIIWTGLVPHDEILRYYSIMDVLVYPRIDARINHAVTPLKPLEAMAMNRLCIASDVGGLKELVEDGSTGLLFATGNEVDLAEKLLLASKDRGLRDRIAAGGFSMVKKEREWSTIVSRYADIYRHVASGWGAYANGS